MCIPSGVREEFVSSIGGIEPRVVGIKEGGDGNGCSVSLLQVHFAQVGWAPLGLPQLSLPLSLFLDARDGLENISGGSKA